MIKSIAVHLPQFHSNPENDAWWGKGFTEWTNVVNAKPLFKNHYQPHLPGDLGFYDLRVEESRIAQAELARAHGIHGFCYYHYWFNGKRLLSRPVDDMRKTQTPDFPFMLCWANENWTRKWDGLEEEVLIRQDYNAKDDEEHMRFLCENFFSDRRYIRVDNKPFFLVYRPALNGDIRNAVDRWRKTARAMGVDGLYIGYMRYVGAPDLDEGIRSAFDCSVDFQPDFNTLPARLQENFIGRVLNKIGLSKSNFANNRIFDYTDYVDGMMKRGVIQPNTYPGITPMWDNTARRKTGATVFANATPLVYRAWLDHIIKEYKKVDAGNKFIFINAWNEWAEGNHLEPCRKWGMQYLEATKEALRHA